MSAYVANQKYLPLYEVVISLLTSVALSLPLSVQFLHSDPIVP